MAITLPSGLYLPFGQKQLFLGNNATTLNATGLKTAFIGQLYLQGRASGSKTLNTSGSSAFTIEVNSRTWSTSGSTIDIGIQGVDLTSGPPVRPDGSFSVKKTLTQGTDTINTGINSFVPATGSVSLSHGDIFAFVFDFTNRAGADSFATFGPNFFAAQSNESLPLQLHYNGSAWSNAATSVNVMLTFSDGTKGWINGMRMAGDNLNHTFNSSSNPFERGIAFSWPTDTVVDALWTQVRGAASTSDFDLTLYSDPLGTPTAIETLTLTMEQCGAVNQASLLERMLTTQRSLTANAVYGVVMKATGAGNQRLDYLTMFDSAMREMWPAGAICSIWRNGGTGAFSSSDVIHFGMGARAIQLPSGGGSARPVHPLQQLVIA